MAPLEPVGPDKELINLAFRIKPVMTMQSGHLHFIEPMDLYAKLWSEFDSAGRAESHVTELARLPVKVPVPFQQGFIEAPTMAQVLPQIPKEYRDKAVAFEVRSTDDRDGANGYMWATLTLYGGTLPPEIQDQPVQAWKKIYTAPFPPEPEPQVPFNKAAATTLQQDVQVGKPMQIRKDGPGSPGGF